MWLGGIIQKNFAMGDYWYGWWAKMNKWGGCFAIGLIVTIIDFFIMINQEDASLGAKITATILMLRMADFEMNS